MILIGQYDSPFVRRVAVALQLYGMAYEHRPWSVFGDVEQVARYNPLRRVPVLVLDGGEALVDSVSILDHLDEVAGPEQALFPAAGPARRAALRLTAFGTGIADKAVSLVYSRAWHRETAGDWIARCRGQISSVLDHLEAERSALPGPFWFGERIGHGDIALACALRFTAEAHPGVFEAAHWPHLAAHAARCEALPAFSAVVQPLVTPD
ncbi:glutathione S-transferase family protein [Zavarzinia sp.]|uniref:glutathione S-transferase family protein n=1 Tax=Zavarzinia sp. TaxID=2027920 RepID=UPI0035692F92